MVNEAHTQKKRKHPEATSARKKADGKRQHVHKGDLLTLRITDLWGKVIIYRLRVLMKPSWPAARFAWLCQTEHQQYEWNECGDFVFWTWTDLLNGGTLFLVTCSIWMTDPIFGHMQQQQQFCSQLDTQLRILMSNCHQKIHSSMIAQFHPLTFSCPWHVLVTCWWFGIFVVYLARHSFSLPSHWRSWKSHLTIRKAKHLCCLKSILHCSASLWQTQSSEMNFSIEESAIARWGLRCIFVLFFPSSDSRNFQWGQVSVWWSQTEAQWSIYCGWNGAADLNGKLERWLVWLLWVTKPTQIHRSHTCPNNPAGLV